MVDRFGWPARGAMKEVDPAEGKRVGLSARDDGGRAEGKRVGWSARDNGDDGGSVEEVLGQLAQGGRLDCRLAEVKYLG